MSLLTEKQIVELVEMASVPIYYMTRFANGTKSNNHTKHCH